MDHEKNQETGGEMGTTWINGDLEEWGLRRTGDQ